jgi:Secretion system C-terminal sorting domain/Fibronectin type III domain
MKLTKKFRISQVLSLSIALLFLMVFSISGTQAQGCSQPSNLNSNVLASGTVSVSWAAIPAAVSYVVQYRLGTSPVWLNGGTVTTPNQVLTGLATETVYSWRVRANCSTFSSTATFNSSGAVGGNTACSSPSNTIASVVTATTADLNWSSILGALYYTVQYRVINTLAWRSAGSVTGTQISVAGLTLGTEYEWRVKASCSVYSSVDKFTTLGGAGGGNSACSQPSNLDALPISNTVVSLAWSAIQEATSYTVEYRAGLAGTWINAGTTTGTMFNLSGLTANTAYQWRVKANCSAFSSEAVFTTTGSTTGGGGSTTCSSPSNTNLLSVAATSAVVQWEAQGGALNYTVQYRLELGGAYVTVGTFTDATATITGLTPLTKYQWRVKANCSPYGSDVQFETSAPVFALAQRQGTSQQANELKMSVFPNPATDDVVQIEAEPNSRLMIVDAAGQVVENIVTTNSVHTTNIAQFRNGLYLVRMQKADGSMQTTKFMVAH